MVAFRHCRVEQQALPQTVIFTICMVFVRVMQTISLSAIVVSAVSDGDERDNYCSPAPGLVGVFAVSKVIISNNNAVYF